MRVFLRKRPIFESEIEQRGDYDVTTQLPPATAVVHNCLFQADLKTPFIQHLAFDYDHAFDEHASGEQVYRVAAQRLVSGAIRGGVGTLFMFGQTGSGKTYTMTSIQARTALDLFRGAEDWTCDAATPWLTVRYVELRGNRCFDLLAPGQELRLREQGDGTYDAGSMELVPDSPEELCAAMDMAQSRRATSATEANSVSSRSHAVCILDLCQLGGQLVLVDCAGSEWRKDSMYHSKERQQEGAEINTSLHALKECMRYLANQQKVPSHVYRASSLTKVLASAFASSARPCLSVICTASPCASDTEHTIATLRMGMSLAGRGGEREEKDMNVMGREPEQVYVHPKQWTPEEVVEWLSMVDGGQFKGSVPQNFTGAMLVRCPEARFVQLCGGSQQRGRILYNSLRQEMDRAKPKGMRSSR